jgi:hypothetical protein
LYREVKARDGFVITSWLTAHIDVTDEDIVVRYRDGDVVGLTVLHASTRVPALSAK